MDAGGKSDSVAQGVKGNRNAVFYGHGSDFFYLGDPAGPRYVGLKVVNSTAKNEVFKRVAHVQVLADSDWHSAFFAKLSVAGDIFNKKGFFKPEDATVGKSRRRFKPNLQRVPLVRVGHHDEVLAELRTHRADDSNILIQIEPNFDLDAMKTLLGKSPRSFRHLSRLFVIKSGRINPD